jgi:hypothetical protein
VVDHRDLTPPDALGEILRSAVDACDALDHSTVVARATP